jgi:hypothetical protein
MGLVVVVVAVGVAALRFASELWAGILLILTLGGLGAAVLAFHEGNAAPRSWWRGFALFGWGYLVLAMGPWASEAIAPHLPTTMGLDALYARMHPEGTVQQERLALGNWLTSTATAPSSSGPAPPGTALGSSTIAVDTTGPRPRRGRTSSSGSSRRTRRPSPSAGSGTAWGRCWSPASGASSGGPSTQAGSGMWSRTSGLGRVLAHQPGDRRGVARGTRGGRSGAGVVDRCGADGSIP